jgi:type VI protein secretion system component VasK
MIKTKITISDVIYITFTVLCLLSLITNTVACWWFIHHVGFSTKQFLINLLVTSATIFYIWALFKYILIIKIKRNKNN